MGALINNTMLKMTLIYYHIKDQYKLLYTVLIYDYLFGETNITIRDYRNKYDYKKDENSENINKIKIEYKVYGCCL